jgi:hypothetical protein
MCFGVVSRGILTICDAWRQEDAANWLASPGLCRISMTM